MYIFLSNNNDRISKEHMSYIEIWNNAFWPKIQEVAKIWRNFLNPTIFFFTYGEESMCEMGTIRKINNSWECSKN